MPNTDMTEEELENWGLAYVENIESLDDIDRTNPANDLTEQQWEWLVDFFEEI